MAAAHAEGLGGMARPLQVSLPRRWPRLGLAAAAVLLLAAAIASLAAAAQDRRALQVLPEGAAVNGVPIGGLAFGPAVEQVRQRVEAPLHQPVTVTAEGFEATTTAWDQGWRTDVAKVVRGVLGRSREGGLLGRLWRRHFGPHHVVATVRPRWVPGHAGELLAKAMQQTFVAPVAARIDSSSGWVNVLPDQPGRMLDAEGAKQALTRGIERGDRLVHLPTKTTLADVRASAFDTVILVRTGENMLYLYQDGQVVKTYPVATGTARYPTPKGTWHLIRKIVNPVWINPNSDWSAHMPARIGPGPNNPLGSRALALNAEGILIHATPDVSSIGFSASHGCIRMLPSDEEDLFQRVGVGTAVAIVDAGPAKPRTAAKRPDQPQAPATPASDAATQF